MRKWQGIILHHSLTKDTETVSWDAIRKYHIETMKWKDIGYHCGFEYIGKVVAFRKGRSLETDGAACVGKNATHIQLCIVGNFDEVEPTEDMYRAVGGLCKQFMDIYGFGIEDIRGHFAYAPKSCPGKNFNWLNLSKYIK